MRLCCVSGNRTGGDSPITGLPNSICLLRKSSMSFLQAKERELTFCTCANLASRTRAAPMLPRPAQSHATRSDTPARQVRRSVRREHAQPRTRSWLPSPPALVWQSAAGIRKREGGRMMSALLNHRPQTLGVRHPGHDGPWPVPGGLPHWRGCNPCAHPCPPRLDRRMLQTLEAPLFSALSRAPTDGHERSHLF